MGGVQGDEGRGGKEGRSRTSVPSWTPGDTRTLPHTQAKTRGVHLYPNRQPREHQGRTRRPRDISVLPVMKRLPRGAGPRSLDCAERRGGEGASDYRERGQIKGSHFTDFNL